MALQGDPDLMMVAQDIDRTLSTEVFAQGKHNFRKSRSILEGMDDRRKTKVYQRLSVC